MDQVFSYPKYVLKRQGLSIFGKYRLCSEQDEVLLYIEEKNKWIPPSKNVRICLDEKMKQEILLLKDSDYEDFEDSYNVIDAKSAEKIGGLGILVEDLVDFVRDKWSILDAENKPIAQIYEKSAGQAFLREMSEHMLPQQMCIMVGETLVGELHQKFNSITYQLQIDFSMDMAHILDRRLGIAAAIIVALHQGAEV